jgi:hypothetical protein
MQEISEGASRSGHFERAHYDDHKQINTSSESPPSLKKEILERLSVVILGYWKESCVSNLESTYWERSTTIAISSSSSSRNLWKSYQPIHFKSGRLNFIPYLEGNGRSGCESLSKFVPRFHSNIITTSITVWWALLLKKTILEEGEQRERMEGEKRKLGNGKLTTSTFNSDTKIQFRTTNS